MRYERPVNLAHYAARAGVSEDEYVRRREAGLLWCCGCREWHPVDRFSVDNSRPTGRATRCLEYNREYSRRWYARKKK